jgi:hypothetical protein
VSFALALVAAAQIARAADPVKPGVNPAPPTTSQAPATCVPTFHCLSLYWSPERGQAGKQVLVKFRQLAEPTWHDALPMRYNPVKSPECKADYRGSMTDYAALKAAGAPVLGWGEFITVLINFLILAFIIFLLVRWATRLMRRRDEAPAGPTEVELLSEIRDELKKR